MRRSAIRLIHIGIKGHVIALDRATGTEIWRTKLSGVRMKTSDFVYLSLDGDQLYATLSGEIFCLDVASGEVRWHEQLRGLGTGLVSIVSASAPASDGGPSSLLSRAERDRNAQGAAGAVG